MLTRLKLAIVDVETTGGSAGADRVMEIGIRRIERGAVVGTYTSLVNPECRIPYFIQQLTGITNEDVEEAPTFTEIHREVRELLGDCLFVAHNVRFDYGFIREEFARLNQRFVAPCLCTVRLSRLLYPDEPRHDLGSLIERFQLPSVRRHRALDDADAVWAFLQHAQRDVASDQFTMSLSTLLEQPTLPPQLPAEILERLQTGPGAYVFYDQAGTPLYVGKSVAIRDRVLGHFSPHRSAGVDMRLARQTARVEPHPTSGELGALLLELELIKTLHPLWNQRATKRQGFIALRRQRNRQGYTTVQLTPLETASAHPSTIVGIFKSQSQAQTWLHEHARAHQLCLRLLGLERSKGACFLSQVGICLGACQGRESAIRYNARMALAFSHRPIRAWPYSGPIAIEEQNVVAERGELMVFDQWRLLHALRYDHESVSEWLTPHPQFDYEIYRVLTRYLNQHPHRARPLTTRALERLLITSASMA